MAKSDGGKEGCPNQNQDQDEGKGARRDSTRAREACAASFGAG